jgi:hypothetical protein
MDAADWAVPHTRYAAHPSLELPDGAIVATTRPERWQGQPVRVLDINPWLQAEPATDRSWPVA